jgi:hypothetical protein
MHIELGLYWVKDMWTMRWAASAHHTLGMSTGDQSPALAAPYTTCLGYRRSSAAENQAIAVP